MSSSSDRHYAFNFFISLFDAGFFLVGLSFLSSTVILPLFLSRFTSAQWMLGLIPGLLEATIGLPQLFLVGLVSRQTRHLPLVLWTGMLPRVVFLLFAALMFFSPQLPAAFVAVGVLVLVALFGLGGGFASITWQEMIANVVPEPRRGQFFGVRQVVGGVLSVGGAALAGWLLATYPFPLNFTYCALAGFASFMISWVFVVPTREPAAPPRPAPPPSLLRAGLGRLRQDTNFARFSGAYALITLGSLATGFYTVYAVQRFGLTDAQAGGLNTLWFAANTISNFFWGWLGDRAGPKQVLVVGAGAQLAAAALALFAPSFELFAVAFALASAAAAGIIISSITLPMVIGPREERPLYIGLTNTLRTPASVGAPLLGGWLVSQWGFGPMLGAAVVLGGVGLVVLAGWVKVPHAAAATSMPEPLREGA